MVHKNSQIELNDRHTINMRIQFCCDIKIVFIVLINHDRGPVSKCFLYNYINSIVILNYILHN